MEASDYIKVYSGSFIIVEVIRKRLNEIGIVPIIKDESESGRLAGFPTSMQDIQEVFVHKDELEKTTPIVQQIRLETEQSL